MTLYYCPLEPYQSRYTELLSAPETGWMERNWIQAKVDYLRVVGVGRDYTKDLNTGVVLDCFRRSRSAIMQVRDLIIRVECGKVTSEDVIYLEDVFHPGAEALPYCFRQYGIAPKVYAYWWAQSVDEYDFTRPMRNWMQHYEAMMLSWLAGVFVACPSMKKTIFEEFEDHWPSSVRSDKIHVVGLPFDPEDVFRRTPAEYQLSVLGKDVYGKPFANSAGEPICHPRKNQVVFSSRWDQEKNPDFFCRVAGDLLRNKRVPDDTRFVVCTGHPKLRTNNHEALAAASALREEFPQNFVVLAGLTKEKYYSVLCESKVQFNCASQDWVSFTLLEASVCGCYPVYPYFRSFLETLGGRPNEHYLYTHLNLGAAAQAVENVLRRDDLWTPARIRNRSWIHRRFASTWARMLLVMGVPMTAACDVRNPFNNKEW